MKDNVISPHKYSCKNFISKTLITFLSLTLFSLFTYSQNDIKKSPLVLQADSLFKIQIFDEALKNYELSFKSGNIYCDDYYTAARCAAMLNNNILAFKYLKLSIKNGFVDEKFANNDYYFTNLHKQKAWAELKPLFNSLKIKIEKELVGLKNIPCYRLIPFCSKGLWGYMDSKDTSIVVKSIFQYVGFMTNVTVVCYKSKTALYISKDGKIREMYTMEMEDSESMMGGGNSKFKLITSLDGYKGFKHKNGYITEHSDIYSTMEENTFKIKNKIYGIAYINDKAGIIDEEGILLNGFNFEDNCANIMRCYDTNDSLLWFWFTDTANGTGYRNEKGETYFYNTFKNYPGFGYKTTWSYSYEQAKNGNYGIFDFKNIKWRVEPQPLEILKINFNNRECKPNSPSEPNKLFFLVKSTGGEVYYMDEELNEYRIDKDSK